SKSGDVHEFTNDDTAEFDQGDRCFAKVPSRRCRRMEPEPSAFAKLIQEDRAAREGDAWEGTFLDYLELVRRDPSLPTLAHSRIYELVVRDGVRDILDTEDPKTKRLYQDQPVKSYPFFSEEFFGIEKTISQIVRYFHAAALKGEESRQ